MDVISKLKKFMKKDNEAEKKEFWQKKGWSLQSTGTIDCTNYKLRLYGVYLPDVGYINIGVHLNPFANCQTFTISNAYSLQYLEREHVDRLIVLIRRNLTGKRQVLIDIREEYLTAIKKVFNNYTKKKITETKYESTNGSNMVLLLIQLDCTTIAKLEMDYVKADLINFDAFRDNSHQKPKPSPNSFQTRRRGEPFIHLQSYEAALREDYEMVGGTTTTVEVAHSDGSVTVNKDWIKPEKKATLMPKPNFITTMGRGTSQLRGNLSYRHFMNNR